MDVALVIASNSLARLPQIAVTNYRNRGPCLQEAHVMLRTDAESTIYFLHVACLAE